MTLRDAEFRALRDTIAWRGTVRMALVPLVVIGWALVWSTLFLAAQAGFTAAIPLLVLAAGYEAIHACHVGAERIGRYLQVSYENGPDGALWESTAMRIGPGLPGGGVDPLFTPVFLLATLANVLLWLPGAPGLRSPGAALMLALHGAFGVRLLRARRAAAQQRAVELETVRAVHAELTARRPAGSPDHAHTR